MYNATVFACCHHSSCSYRPLKDLSRGDGNPQSLVCAKIYLSSKIMYNISLPEVNMWLQQPELDKSFMGISGYLPKWVFLVDFSRILSFCFTSVSMLSGGIVIKWEFCTKKTNFGRYSLDLSNSDCWSIILASHKCWSVFLHRTRMIFPPNHLHEKRSRKRSLQRQYEQEE